MEQTKITLVCDGCGTDSDDVETRRVRQLGLEGEACADCWTLIEEAVKALAEWRPVTSSTRRRVG